MLSCSPQYKLRKLLEHHPELATIDSIPFADTTCIGEESFSIKPFCGEDLNSLNPDSLDPKLNGDTIVGYDTITMRNDDRLCIKIAIPRYSKLSKTKFTNLDPNIVLGIQEKEIKTPIAGKIPVKRIIPPVAKTDIEKIYNELKWVLAILVLLGIIWSIVKIFRG